MSEKAEKFADVGDIVTCTNGHEICDVAEQLFKGGLLKSSSFKNFRDGYIPKESDPVTKCPICGAWYIGIHAPGDAKVYINGKWVP